MKLIKPCFVQGNVLTKEVYMTSGFQPPTNSDLNDRIKVSAYMQGYASGGSVENIFIDGKVNSNFKKKLIKKIFNKPVNYITLSPIVSICNSCKTKHVGEFYTCPTCNDSENMIVMARIIGYVRPIVSGKVEVNDGRIEGTDNYWQEARRVDWAERNKI